MLSALLCVIGLSSAVVALAPATPPQGAIEERADAGCHLPVLAPESAFAGARWLGGNVPYQFAANVSAAQQTAMLAAMQLVQGVVFVHFVPRTAEADYVVIQDAPLNSSPVGRQGGIQLLLIYNWNQPYAMVHELMHVLGFWHEHQRPDRDTYITVQMANVLASETVNFQIAPTVVTYGSAYDFDSVMHYDQLAASSNGQPTIVVNPPNQGQQTLIGQRTHFSAADLEGLRLTYGSLLPPTISSLTPGSSPSYLPVPIVLTGLLFDEVTRVNLDSASITFTRPAANQIRIVLPQQLAIGGHQITVESSTGPSQPMVLQITGSDPPVVEGASILVRGTFNNTLRVHTDNVRLNVLLLSLDPLPSSIPGVVQLGLGNQFQTLFTLAGPVTANASGLLTSTLVVPTAAGPNLFVYLQSIVYDPANLALPITTSNLFTTHTL
jgi:hypothetical protein